MQVAINEKSKEVEAKEAVRLQIIKLAGELDGVNALISMQNAACSLDNVTEAEKILEEIEKAKSRLCELAEDLKNNDFDDFVEDELSGMKKKIEEAEADVCRLQGAAEILREYIESLNIWHEDKKVLSEMVKPNMVEAGELISRYVVVQPYETAIADVKIVEDLADRLVSAQKQAENAANGLRNAVPECEVALNEAKNFADELLNVATELQVCGFGD